MTISFSMWYVIGLFGMLLVFDVLGYFQKERFTSFSNDLYILLIINIVLGAVFGIGCLLIAFIFYKLKKNGYMDWESE